MRSDIAGMVAAIIKCDSSRRLVRHSFSDGGSIAKAEPVAVGEKSYTAALVDRENAPRRAPVGPSFSDDRWRWDVKFEQAKLYYRSSCRAKAQRRRKPRSHFSVYLPLAPGVLWLACEVHSFDLALAGKFYFFPVSPQLGHSDSIELATKFKKSV